MADKSTPHMSGLLTNTSTIRAACDNFMFALQLPQTTPQETRRRHEVCVLFLDTVSKNAAVSCDARIQMERLRIRKEHDDPMNGL